MHSSIVYVCFFVVIFFKNRKERKKNAAHVFGTQSILTREMGESMCIESRVREIQNCIFECQGYDGYNQIAIR